MSLPLENQRAVVTGVTSGIGEALVERLLRSGASVAGVGRDAAKLAACKERWGPRFTRVEADLADPGARARAASAIAEQLERIDVVINNAADCVFETWLGVDAARWSRLFEVNVTAALDIVQRLSPRVADGGQILNVSSVVARSQPFGRFSPYALTKSALDELTIGLRSELAARGVKVMLLAPGLVDTPIYDKVEGFEATRAALKKQVPRWLEPGEVADVALWMLTRPPSIVLSDVVVLPRHQAR
jgi:NAD(P)-dependent dehydrogenase (short-subunit alcohol dehydrogenase family)